MYKIIIFSNNFDVVKKTCNILLSKFNTLHLLGIASTYDELSEFLNNSKANLIFISESDIKVEKIEQLIKNIETKVVLCQNSTKHKNSKHILYLPLETDSEYSAKQFKNFVSEVDNQAIRKKVFNILQKLNFDFKLIGTNYLLDAVIYSYINRNDYRYENLERYIYPYVAKLHNASSNKVKWAIIRSVNNMSSHLNSSGLKEPYIKFCDKPTSKLVVNEIVDRI